MNEEALGINSQSYGIVYQRKGNQRQYHCQSQQHQADVTDIVIYRIYQVFLVKYLLDIGIPLYQLFYLGDTVRIGVVGMQFYLYGRREGIITKELLRVCPHCFSLFTKRLFL